MDEGDIYITHTYTHTHKHTHAYTHTCTHTHACTYTHTHTHTHKHTHIHTRTSNIQAVMLLYQSRVQVVHLLLQKSTDRRGVGISSMRKSIYLLKTTPSSHTHRLHPLPLATSTSCSPHPLATPIHSTHSPQLSSIL